MCSVVVSLDVLAPPSVPLRAVRVLKAGISARISASASLTVSLSIVTPAAVLGSPSATELGESGDRTAPDSRDKKRVVLCFTTRACAVVTIYTVY